MEPLLFPTAVTTDQKQLEELSKLVKKCIVKASTIIPQQPSETRFIIPPFLNPYYTDEWKKISQAEILTNQQKALRHLSRKQWDRKQVDRINGKIVIPRNSLALNTYTRSVYIATGFPVYFTARFNLTPRTDQPRKMLYADYLYVNRNG